MISRVDRCVWRFGDGRSGRANEKSSRRTSSTMRVWVARKVLSRVPGTWFARFVNDDEQGWEKAREQKTTSVVKRKHRGGVCVSLTRVTRRDVTWRDVTWRDVTWRRGVEMPRDEMAVRLGSLAPLFALLLYASSGCHARITNQEIGEC
jgi:hypothetical protein